MFFVESKEQLKINTVMFEGKLVIGEGSQRRRPEEAYKGKKEEDPGGGSQGMPIRRNRGKLLI